MQDKKYYLFIFILVFVLISYIISFSDNWGLLFSSVIPVREELTVTVAGLGLGERLLFPLPEIHQTKPSGISWRNCQTLQIIGQNATVIVDIPKYQTFNFTDLTESLNKTHQLMAGEKKQMVELSSRSRKLMGFLNPYSVFGGSKVVFPYGIPEYYRNNTDVIHPALALKQVDGSISMVQGVLACSEKTNCSSGECSGECLQFPQNSKNLVPELVVNNQYLVPTNALYTFYSYRMFCLLYTPQQMNSNKSEIWKSYIVQAIFRLLNLNLGFVGLDISLEQNHFDENIGRDYLDDAEIDTLSEKLAEWIESKLRGSERGFRGGILQDIYTFLLQHNQVSEEELTGVQNWQEELEGLGVSCDFVINPSLEGESKLPAKPFPVFGVIYLWDNFAHLSGLLHAVYNGIYEKIIIMADIQDHNNPKLTSPVPEKTIYHNSTGGGGVCAYDTYLEAVSILSSATDPVPDTIIWHHDDMVVNFTTLQTFLDNKEVFIAGLPHGTETEETEVERLSEAVTRNYSYESGWVWTGMINNSLHELAKEHVDLFLKNNTVCSVYYKAIQEKNMEPLSVLSHIFAAQADFLLTKWRHQKLEDFHEKLNVMKNYHVFLEAAVSLTMRCSLSANEIDANYVAQNFTLTTYWDGNRNNAATLISDGKKKSQDIHHPNKLGTGLDHVIAALEFRDLTLPHKT